MLPYIANSRATQRFLTSDEGQQLATNDKELVLLLVRAHGAEAFRKVSDELKNDKKVVMAAVAKDPNAFDDAVREQTETPKDRHGYNHETSS